MSECEKCGKILRDRYNLLRHQSRSRPCTDICSEIGDDREGLVNPKSSLVNPKSSLVNPKSSLVNPKSSLVNSKSSCKYCMNNFYNKGNMKKHLLICKYRNDPIRLLEIENDIEPILPESKTCCRFCEKDLSRISYLNKHLLVCKEREIYHDLIKNKNTITVNNINTINNINNINTINNINNINILGQESTEHIQIEDVVNLLRNVIKEFGNNQISLTAGNLINSFDNYIRENPENQNIVIPHHKSIFGNIKTETGWKKMSVDRCLNRAFKSSANELYNRKEEIDNHNKQVFKSLTNKQIFSEVKQFGVNGLSGNSDEIRQIKTSFKIDKLKESEIKLNEIDL